MALQRLTESFSISMSDVTPSDFKASKIPLKEGTENFVEDAKGNKFKCIAAYRVPISRYDWKNLNGRIYSKALWENIINKQKNIWEGGDGLADHPIDEGAVKDSFCVWHNLNFSESSSGIVEADLYLIGNWGRLAQEKLEAGGKLGFSSSGFGELLEDGSTVNPDSYQLERVSDWVLNPSQNVFGDISMMKKETTSPQRKTEEVEIKENSTMTLNEKADSVNKKLSKSEEKRFRRDVEEFLAEALVITNPSERMREFEEIYSYFDENSGNFEDLKTKVEEQMKLTREEIDAAIREHVSLKETFGMEKVDEIKEGIAKVATDAQLLEKQAHDWKKIAEGLQGKLKEALGELNARPTSDAVQQEKAASLKARKLFERKIAFMQHQIKNFRKNSMKNAAIEEKTLQELNKLQKSIEAAKNSIVLKNKVIEALKVELGKMSERAESAEKYLLHMKEAQANVIREKPLDAPKDMFRGYREEGQVANYYKDLESRHGKAIAPYKSKILACKTFFEASKLYTQILSEMGAITPAAGGLERSERRAFTEASTGRKIIDKAPLNLPDGWL